MALVCVSSSTSSSSSACFPCSPPPPRAPKQLSGDEVVIEDASGQVCGSVHLGRGLLADATGATVAEVRRDGTLVREDTRSATCTRKKSRTLGLFSGLKMPAHLVHLVNDTRPAPDLFSSRSLSPRQMRGRWAPLGSTLARSRRLGSATSAPRRASTFCSSTQACSAAGRKPSEKTRGRVT